MKDISFIFTREPDSMSGVRLDFSNSLVKIDMLDDSKLHPSLLEIFGRINYDEFVEDSNLIGYTQKPISFSALTIKNLYIGSPFAIRVSKVKMVYTNTSLSGIQKYYYFPRIKYNKCSFDSEKYAGNNLVEFVGCEWREE